MTFLGFLCPVCVCVMHCRRRFFSEKSDVPGIYMPCVCVMHCRRRFFFGKNDVPEILMPCIFLESCIFIDFHRFSWISIVLHGFEGFWGQDARQPVPPCAALWRSVAACAALWPPVAACGSGLDPL